jgi:hypothetical protein
MTDAPEKKPRKKGINGRVKGNKNERAVAALVQTWWRQLEPECEFVRTPLSGGWSTGNVRAHFAASGDLMTTATHWPYTMEVKAREGWSFKNVLDGKRTPAWGWWRQAQKAASEQKGVAMLWFKRKPLSPRPGTPAFPWLIWVPASYVAAHAQALPPPDVRYSRALLTRNEVDWGKEIPVLYFYDRYLATHPRDLISD